MPWPAQLALVLLVGLPLIFAAGFAVVWSLVWCYERLFRARTHAAANAVARELHLKPVLHPDARVMLRGGKLLDASIEVAANAWIVVDGAHAELAYARVAGLVVRVRLPHALPVHFVIDAGRGIEANFTSGHADFDSKFRLYSADGFFIQSLLDSTSLRDAITAAAGTGVRPIITHESVNLVLAERKPAEAVAAAHQAVRIAKLLAERTHFMSALASPLPSL